MTNGQRQGRVRKEAERLLRAGVAGDCFPGGVACLGWMEKTGPLFVTACAGSLGDGGGHVEPTTPYDLASLTKPVVATAALRLVAAGRLRLEDKAETYLVDARGAPGGEATLEQLLTHRAGLAAWGALYLDVPHELGTTAARRWIVAEAARRPDERSKKTSPALYSDLGYVLAGEMIAKAAGQPLDRVVATHVTAPLGIATELFYAGALSPSERAQLAKRAAPTERDPHRGRIVRGEVHDENAYALGGVAGHAGLFGTAQAVAVVGRTMLDVRAKRSTFLPEALLARALAPRPGSTERLGWDGKSANNSSAGKRIVAESFGHLGFTGTSIWCDPKRDLVVVLLTNRVHPSRANERIKGFRPAFHDGVVGVFDG